MRVERTSWDGRARVDITASLPSEPDATLRRALLGAIGNDGCTLREALGYWHGAAERAYTVERIDPPAGWVARIVAAAIGAGCECVQVERYGERAGNGGYSAEEWRGHGNPAEVCEDCGNRTVTTHPDGSQTCGHCFVQAAT